MPNPSPYTKQFAADLGHKLAAQYEVLVEAGRVYDKIKLRGLKSYSSPYGVTHAFVVRKTGGLVKPGGKQPQRSPDGVLAVRYDLSDEESYREALENADPYGSYLYVR